MKNKIIYSYSCVCKSDLGILAGKISERLSENKVASVVILPDPFEDDKEIVKKAKKADLNITIDGCKTGCAHTALRVRKIPHLQFYMTEFGCEKKKTEVTEELIERIAAEITKKIGVHFEDKK
jgi:uncharacterized metal-binding protein